MKQAIGMLIWLLLAAAAASVYQTAESRRMLEQHVIRLHILANSDSTADQTDKLLVRDALLARADEWLPAGADDTAAGNVLTASLPAIRETAEQALRDAGCTDPVTASFGTEAFPERSYGQFTLPAGEYRSLRIEIGSGEGQNWWCVMYPSLCIPAASESACVLPEEASALTAHPENFELRLKCADVCVSALRRIRRALRDTEKPASPEGEAGGEDQQPQPPLLQPQPLPQPLPQHENRRIRIMIHQRLLPQSLPHIVSTPFHRM